MIEAVYRLLVVFLVTSCLRTSSVSCPDGRTCPEGTVCTTTSVEGPLCVDPGALAECADQVDGTACSNGRCYEQVCLPAGCGNRHVDAEEICDDGNHNAGDGCAADCLSDERCGNGLLDPAELCDDGNAISHDGCSSACDPELPRWTNGAWHFPVRRGNAAVGYDVARDRVVVFSGREDQGLPNLQHHELEDRGWLSPFTLIYPRPREGGRMVYDAARARMLMFGGGNPGVTLGPYNDTWTWSGIDWTELEPVHAPPPRRDHVMVYDSARDVTVVFGGNSDPAAAAPLGDTWTFDGTDWQELATLPSPPPRFDAAMAYDPARGVIVLAGGADSLTGAPLADTWELDAGGWRQRANLPQGVSQHALAYDPTNRKMLALGGINQVNGAAVSSVLAWDGAAWTQLTVVLAIARRKHAAITSADGRVIVVGGYSDATNTTTAVEFLSATASAGFNPERPSARSQHATASLPGGRALTFGGIESIGDLDETWEADGATWTPLAPAMSPSARHGHAMVYDAARDRVVLFGGEVNTTLSQETWLWNGATWMPASPANQPSPRKWHSMVYDAARARVVLFGGETDTGGQIVSGETWSWDGTNWTLLDSTVEPAPRALAGMAYDPVRERVVLFGGRDFAAGLAYADQYEWNGTTWNDIAALNPPAGRQAAAMGFNAARGRVMLSSGHSGSNQLQDAWEWNGTSWHEVLTPTVPSGSQFATSSAIGSGTSFFHGEYNGFPAATVWTMRYSGRHAPENCRSTGHDADGDDLVGCEDPDCWYKCRPACPPGASCDPTAARCGDSVCAPYETCRSCATDCGTCTPVCGDLLCEGEQASCPGDC